MAMASARPSGNARGKRPLGYEDEEDCARRRHRQVVVVEDSQDGTRLGDYLPRRWPDVDRVFLRNLVLEGCVLVNGATSDVRQRLRAGDVVVVELPGPVAELPRFRAPTEEIERFAMCISNGGAGPL